jgi:hypothetical protein
VKAKAVAKKLNGRPFSAIYSEWATLVHCAAAPARSVFPLTAGSSRNGGWESAGKVFAFFILSIKWKSEESFDSGCDFS